MSVDDFQLLNNESFDNSIIKRDFLKNTMNKEHNLINQIKILNIFSARTIIIIK